MKQDDFERIKAICEKEGFDINKASIGDIDGWFTIDRKTDPWEGVEFAYHEKGVVEKIKEIKGDFVFFEPYGRLLNSPKKYLTPSTETAYVEQLKKEAFERFGEIQEGDRVDFTNVGFPKQINKDIELGDGFPNWKYFKESDKLLFYGWVIYQQGKWAERVNERVSVEWDGGNIQDKSFYFMYDKKTEEKLIQMSFSKAGEFLASQLEKYLNGEIE